jgi:hypothetical protein
MTLMNTPEFVGNRFKTIYNQYFSNHEISLFLHPERIRLKMKTILISKLDSINPKVKAINLNLYASESNTDRQIVASLNRKADDGEKNARLE